MNPCKVCVDHFCCRQMCIDKKRYLDFLEGERSTYRVPTISHRKKVVTVNKNGIRREEYI